jgi:hypothetical protein
MGQAPQRYDDYQKDMIMMKIAKTKKQMLSFVRRITLPQHSIKVGLGVTGNFRYNLGAPFVQQDPFTLN